MWSQLCFSPAVFSAVTLLLLPHSQGNMWLFEDSVLITRKLPGEFTHLTSTSAANHVSSATQHTICAVTGCQALKSRVTQLNISIFSTSGQK